MTTRYKTMLTEMDMNERVLAGLNAQPEQEPHCYVPPEREDEFHHAHETITAYREPRAGWMPMYRRPPPLRELGNCDECNTTYSFDPTDGGSVCVPCLYEKLDKRPPLRELSVGAIGELAEKHSLVLNGNLINCIQDVLAAQRSKT